MLFNNGGTMYSGTPGSVAVFGGFVWNTGSGSLTANTVIQATNYVPSTNATSGATVGIGKTLSPLATRVPCVIYPTTAYAPQVAPAAANTVFMLDLRGYPADIASVHLMYTPPPASNGALPSPTSSANAQILAIDNVNNFVYGTVTSNAGSQIALSNGAAISFVVFFKDSVSV